MQRKDNFAPDNFYHIYNRGIDKRIIFKSDSDYKRFMMLLFISNNNESIRLNDILDKNKKNYSDIFNLKLNKPLVSIGAWSLMPNHFHILLREETEGGISKFMKKLGTGYSMYFNLKYKRTGGLFGGPFKSKLVEEDNYLRYLLGYFHLNPLEIKFPNWEKTIGNGSHKEWQNYLRSYRYSSYQDYIDMERVENKIINTKNFPNYFDKQNSFKDFIKDYISLNQENSELVTS